MQVPVLVSNSLRRVSYETRYVNSLVAGSIAGVWRENGVGVHFMVIPQLSLQRISLQILASLR